MMKRAAKSLIVTCLLGAVLSPASAAEERDYIQRFDTLYNSLTLERNGTIIEMRARARGSEALESAVDLADPLTQVVPYTRVLYTGLLLKEKPPAQVLMIGLGGAGFHRLFTAGFPNALLQTAELDPKVFELCQSHMGFQPTERTPVALMDGRMFVKRDRRNWDWLILDAFRGGFVPPHLKTEEFYRECAARLTDDGVFTSNLHPSNKLYLADLRTIQRVFPQVVLFRTPDRGNVIAHAVKFTHPKLEDLIARAPADDLSRTLLGRVDLEDLRKRRTAIPAAAADAPVLTDDFAPVEFLDALKLNNEE